MFLAKGNHRTHPNLSDTVIEMERSGGGNTIKDRNEKRKENWEHFYDLTLGNFQTHV